MITEIKFENGEYVFYVGRCKYKCPDFLSLTEVRAELIAQNQLKTK